MALPLSHDDWFGVLIYIPRRRWAVPLSAALEPVNFAWRRASKRIIQSPDSIVIVPKRNILPYGLPMRIGRSGITFRDRFIGGPMAQGEQPLFWRSEFVICTIKILIYNCTDPRRLPLRSTRIIRLSVTVHCEGTKPLRCAAGISTIVYPVDCVS